MKNRILLVAVVGILSACGDTINGKALSEPEVTHFHDKLKRRDFEGMYETTSPEFQAALPKAKTLALFEAIDRKLGPLQDSKQINWNVSTFNTTTTVILVYQSTFQEGEATETFTFRVQGQRPELFGYNISSLDMLIK